MDETKPNILMQDWEDEYLIETAIESPRVWVTLNDEIEIQELKSDRFDEVLKIIKVKHNTKLNLDGRKLMCIKLCIFYGGTEYLLNLTT